MGDLAIELEGRLRSSNRKAAEVISIPLGKLRVAHPHRITYFNTLQLGKDVSSSATA